MVFSFWMFARALALLVGTLCGAVCTRKITPELINRHHAIIFVTFTAVSYAPSRHALNHYRAAVLVAVNIAARKFRVSVATGS